MEISMPKERLVPSEPELHREEFEKERKCPEEWDPIESPLRI